MEIMRATITALISTLIALLALNAPAVGLCGDSVMATASACCCAESSTCPEISTDCCGMTEAPAAIPGNNADTGTTVENTIGPAEQFAVAEIHSNKLRSPIVGTAFHLGSRKIYLINRSLLL